MRCNHWLTFVLALITTAAVTIGVHVRDQARLEREIEAQAEMKCNKSKERIDDLAGTIRSEQWLIEVEETQVSTVGLGPDHEFAAAFRTGIRDRKARVKNLQKEWEDENKRFVQLITSFRYRFGRAPESAIKK